MEVAWTTIVIIALLLPGVFFFIGYATGDRYAREIVKSSAIGEVGWAIAISILIHLLAWGILSSFGFDLAFNIREIAAYDRIPRWLLANLIVARIFPLGAYILLTALVGFVAGWLVSRLAQRGYLPFLVTHKWISQVRRSMKTGLVTAYVMTNTVENNKVLMYKGILAEFYQQKEGKFEYVVLKSCSRYFMDFNEASPKTGEQLQLFGNAELTGRPDGVWDFLQIEGGNISNILFDPSPEILITKDSAAALDAALAAFLDKYAAEAEANVAKASPPQSNRDTTEHR